GRNPDVTYGDTIEGDLWRRDVTVNAMAIELTTKTFVDPHGGLTALANRSLDTPAPPDESFADDPLRMLRAARFAARLGFTPTQRVVDAMTEMSGELSRVTAERVQTELSKLITGAEPRGGIELRVRTGLAAPVDAQGPGQWVAL